MFYFVNNIIFISIEIYYEIYINYHSGFNIDFEFSYRLMIFQLATLSLTSRRIFDIVVKPHSHSLWPRFRTQWGGRMGRIRQAVVFLTLPFS